VSDAAAHPFATLRPPSGALAVLLRRWQWGLHKRWLRLARPRFGLEQRLGCRWLLDRRNAVDRSLIVRGYWEPEHLALLARLVAEHRPPGVRALFLDIGAHIGTYSILLARQGLFNGIVAFEPEPANAAQLGANLLLNDLLGSVRLVVAAASDRNGRMLFRSGPDHNRGAARSFDLDLPWSTPVTEVACVRAGDAVSLENGFLAAKIDVEGAELAVLAGMEQLLAANRCVLQIECFAGHEAPLLAWLEPRGFRRVATLDVDHFFVKSDVAAAP
jgi:FkbM family methyltransferase